MKTLLLAFLKIFLPVLGLIGLVGYLFAQSGLSNQVQRMQDQDGQLAQSAMVAAGRSMLLPEHKVTRSSIRIRQDTPSIAR